MRNKPYTSQWYKPPEDIVEQEAFKHRAELTYNLAKYINKYNLMPNNYNKDFLRYNHAK